MRVVGICREESIDSQSWQLKTICFSSYTIYTSCVTSVARFIFHFWGWTNVPGAPNFLMLQIFRRNRVSLNAAIQSLKGGFRILNQTISFQLTIWRRYSKLKFRTYDNDMRCLWAITQIIVPFSSINPFSTFTPFDLHFQKTHRSAFSWRAQNIPPRARNASCNWWMRPPDDFCDGRDADCESHMVMVVVLNHWLKQLCVVQPVAVGT